MIHFDIQQTDQKLKSVIQSKIDNKTKPLGALGQLENLALQIALIQGTDAPTLQNPHIIVFAADHGIAKEGVSAYPQEVTYQMVMNFLNQGAAINVFCKQHQISLSIVDAGVNFDFPAHKDLIQAKIAKGTQSFLIAPAMTETQALDAIQKGADIVEEIHKKGCNIIGFGEMGIGNTSSASMLMHFFCNIPLEDCIGKGTGLDTTRLQQKTTTLIKAKIFRNLQHPTALQVLSTFGGFEIAMMVGAMLKAAEQKMVLLIDGFIATSAFLVAYDIHPFIKDYAVFCHQSDEQGHGKILQHLQVKPVLRLDMRLGEGTGCALAYPLIQSAVNFLNEMASFESAGVSNQES